MRVESNMSFRVLFCNASAPVLRHEDLAGTGNWLQETFSNDLIALARMETIFQDIDDKEILY